MAQLSATAPPIPSHVWVTPGNQSTTINWLPVPGATGYQVKYTDRRSGPLNIVAEYIKETSWIHEGIRNRRRAYYAIAATNEAGESSESARLQVTPSEPILDWLSSGAKVEKLADRMIFTEGPVWNPADNGFLIFSDINANRLYRWDFENGLEVFRSPSQRANGNTLDLQGRLITCEHLTRRITRTNTDGSIMTLVETHEGKRFNSPNDAVVKSDGTLWFTDPTWGLTGRKEMDGQYVYRFDPQSNTTTRVADGFQQPNGLCFSPDESILYVAESAGPLNVRAFDVQPDGTLTGDRIFANPNGTPDGMRVDDEGRLYVTAQDVFIYTPDGTQIARIDIPETPANLCFGGPNNEMMFITARSSLYGITKRPDLVVTSIQHIPESPTHAHPITLQAIITNQGSGPTPANAPFEVTFLAGTQPTFILTARLPTSLPAGASALVTVDSSQSGGIWRAAHGRHNISATIDLEGAIPEVSKENNTRNLSVEITQGQTLRTIRDDTTGAIQLQVIGLLGERFMIQTSTDLKEWTHWQDIEIPEESISLIDLNPNQGDFRFYRAIQSTEE